MHLSLYTLLYSAINLRDCQSIKEVREKLKKGIGQEIIVGWGFDHEKFKEGKMPTRKDLDTISFETPIFILRFDEHIGVVNSEVLRRLGINQNSIDPKGGKIGRFPDGQPNGILVDKALPTEDILNNPWTKSSMQQNLLKVQEEFIHHGLTTVSDMGINFNTLDFYRDMEEKGYLKMRVHVYLNEACLKEKKRIEKEMSKNGKGLVQVCGLKLFVDGSFGASSGALYKPYVNEPKNYGILRILPKKLNNLAKQADEMGMQLSIHVIGDRALTYALDALAHTRNRFLRHRVEHIQMVTEEHLKRMKQQEIIAAIQPIFVSTDYPWAEKRLGRERIQQAYPLKRVIEKGIRVAGSSDCPVASADPFLGIYFAVSHKDLEGKELPDWVKKERIGIKEALKIFTEGASYALNENKGQIRQDMLADFIILSENPLSLPIQKVPSLQILQTYIGGQLV